MEKKVVIIFLMLPFLLFWHWFEPAAKKNHQGVEAYQKGNYEEALKSFLSAKGLKPEISVLKNNTASTLYKMKKYQEALEEFSKINFKEAGIPKDQFYYNLGNSYFKLNQFDKALENFKKSLIENPEDMDTKKNYELTLKKLQEQKDKQNKDKKDDKDKEKEKEKKEQEKQQQQQQQQKQQKYQNIMQYLNQNEKEQMEKKQRKIGVARKEKDW